MTTLMSRTGLLVAAVVCILAGCNEDKANQAADDVRAMRRMAEEDKRQKAAAAADDAARIEQRLAALRANRARQGLNTEPAGSASAAR